MNANVLILFHTSSTPATHTPLRVAAACLFASWLLTAYRESRTNQIMSPHFKTPDAPIDTVTVR